MWNWRLPSVREHLIFPEKWTSKKRSSFPYSLMVAFARRSKRGGKPGTILNRRMLWRKRLISCTRCNKRLPSCNTSRLIQKRKCPIQKNRTEDNIMPRKKEVHDPLKGFYGKPIVGEEIPGENRYLGRIIVELYESLLISSDANGLAFTVDPAHQAG